MSDFPARSQHAAAIMLMILNNLDPQVAQFPHELVTYGGNGQVFSNWAQVRTVWVKGKAHRKLKYIYRVSHELRSLLRESVPYVKLYRYNPKHLYPKLNGLGDNGQ